MNSHYLVNRFVVVMLALSALAFSGATGLAQTATETDVNQAQASAAHAVQDVLDSAAAREYNQMYDAMHPDSRELVPRSVALNFFADVYSQAIPSEAVISGIELQQDWVWPVNNVTYPDAAIVTVLIPIIEEDESTTWIEDTWYLAFENGAWYWFLGTSQDFIDQINQRYVGEAGQAADEVTAGEPIPRDEFIQTIVNYIDEFFGEAVATTGAIYQSPGVVVVPEGRSVNSACGPASTGFYGFYCPLDATIYLDEPFLLGLVDQGADFAAAFVIAHEWAHHVQSGLGFDRSGQPNDWNEVYSIELELMADCFAGVWAHDAETIGLITTEDLQEALDLIVYQLGDPKFVGEYDPNSHGNGAQRQRAFMNGYEMGFGMCNLSI